MLDRFALAGGDHRPLHDLGGKVERPAFKVAIALLQATRIGGFGIFCG